MKTKLITGIFESLEKLGYEIINIKEKKESPDFPRSPAIIEIKITPVESNTGDKSLNPIPSGSSDNFIRAFENEINN